MFVHFQNLWKPGGFRKPQTSAQLSRIDPGPHSGVGPGGVGKAQSAKASPTELRLSRLRRLEGVLLEKDRTTCKVSHIKAFTKNSVVDLVGKFLQGDKVPLARNLFFYGIHCVSSGPGFQL